MSDKRKIFSKITDVINVCINSFWDECEREPNKIIMSKDVFDFIVSYGNMLGVYYDNELKGYFFMGKDVEIVTDKKGFIEVGYCINNLITVNVDYLKEGGAE